MKPTKRQAAEKRVDAAVARKKKRMEARKDRAAAGLFPDRFVRLPDGTMVPMKGPSIFE